jgi:hypothetical protein
MNIIKWLFVLAVVVGGYHWWQKHRAESVDVDAQAVLRENGTGFVKFPQPMGTSTRTVLIYAPLNCPSEMAQRANKLARQLEQAGIPHALLQEANFDIDGSDPQAMAQLNSIMAGKGPPVFVRGKAKANPTFDEVVAEYRAPRMH